MSVHRWIAWDVDFLHKPFGMALMERFGPAGVVVFQAFICACKTNRPEGQVAFASDQDTLRVLGLETLRLVDNDGYGWELKDLWTFTGRMKQTRRTSRGRVQNVISTRWNVWQFGEKSIHKRRYRQRGEVVAGHNEGTNGALSGAAYKDFPIEDRDKGASLNGKDLTPAFAELNERMGWTGRATEDAQA
jgi:hypothetical protein